MVRLVMFADDLTGAADAGAPFAIAGFSTVISFAGFGESDADVLISSTESRDVDGASATTRNRQAAKRIASGFESGIPRWVYKKMDSVLRGHPQEELLAIMRTLGEGRALIAPALPSERRTTVGGRQYVAGVPLEESLFGDERSVADLRRVFAQDDGDVTSLLDLSVVRKGAGAVERFLREAAPGPIVADAETDADLRTLAVAAVNGGVRILCGSAGLARQIAEVLPAAGSTSAFPIPARDAAPILMVIGSRHLASAAQVDVLRGAGYPAVSLDQASIDDPATPLHGIVDELCAQLAAGQSVVLTTSGLDVSAHGAAFVVGRLAEAVTAAIARVRIGGLVLTGGDVAAGVLTQMGATALHLRGEIRPAIPWGIAEFARLPPLLISTKAGSFGADDALLACVSFLETCSDANAR